ncbi:MAG: ATP-binding protein [Vulcanococcus sp.]
MAGPMAAERQGCGRPLLRYGLAGVGLAALALLLLELLVGRRLTAQRQQTLADELASRLLLSELALERLTPASLAETGGMRLAVGSRPEAAAAFPGASSPRQRSGIATRPADPFLQAQARDLQRRLCGRLGRCPRVLPALQLPRGVWVALESPLETVWLFVPLPPFPGWPPDPLLLALALGIGGLGGGLLYLSQEVQRPLAALGQAVAAVGFDGGAGAPLIPQGSAAVRGITSRFNAMLERLERGARERTTMLAGIAHDLRAPLTRLRLRLALAPATGLADHDCRRSLGDLEALERITRQFLHYAGQDSAEAALPVALDGLLAELAAQVDALPVSLALTPLERRVRPITLARAVANLLDNALAHGAAPLCLELEADGPNGFLITVWDGGPGMPDEAWSRALEPFQRLDASRSGAGHCGLGLAIAERIAAEHGGGLELRRGPAGFGVALRGRSLAPGAGPGAAQAG